MTIFARIFGSSQPRPARQLEIHPVLADLPIMSDAEFEGLRDSIAALGLQTPISVMGDKLIDGRARLRACEALGIEPRFVEFEDTPADLLATWIAAQNLHRRSLSATQRGMIAARLSLYGGATMYGAAKQCGVSRATTARARAVLLSGDTKIISLIDRGLITADVGDRMMRRRGRPLGPAHEQRAKRLVQDARKLLAGNHRFEAATRGELAALGQALTALADINIAA